MSDLLVAPWILPLQPDLARFSMEVADLLEVRQLSAWPEARKGGIGFGTLPPFLSWLGIKQGRRHLVLLQAREVGALVPGARTAPMPEQWFETLDLESLARPLAHHPDFEGGASVHVVHLKRDGEAQVRSYGEPAPDVIRAVVEKLSDIQIWSFTD
ncbi:MAG: hypothetical protein IPP78_14295 [Holophagaceae bacterium]|nr:hypothetical protein [Holophagaceae bacterium]